MASEIETVRALLAAANENGLESPSWDQRRTVMEATAENMPVAEGVVVEDIELGGVKGMKLTPSTAQANRTLLYFHGGGYCIGSPTSHKSMVSQIAEAMGATAYSMDYRLGPEAPFPAAVDDALASYRALLESDVNPADILISGDSAGGGLSTACAIAARNACLPQPSGLLLISPWADLTNSGWSYEAKATSDPMITIEGISEFSAAYLNGANAKDPLASPCHADLSGLAPMLIQVGSEECLLSDATLLAERAGAAGVRVHLEVWPEMIHVWHAFHVFVEDARKAIERMADWADSAWAR